MLAVVPATLLLAAGMTHAATAVPAATAPTTAAAADCGTLDLADGAAVRERADAVTDVFLGEVRIVRPWPPARRQDRDDRVRRYEHAVVVRHTFRGDLRFREQVRVVTHPRTDDNGFGRLAVDRRYLFFVSARHGGAALVATCDSGTQALVNGLSAGLQSAIDSALTDPDHDAPEVALSEPEEGAGSDPSFTRLAAPGLAVVLIGLLGLLLLVRVGSRRT